ncbi:MAG: hypothetical protein HKN14_11800 [Marinicaulis sp.]|nr:hypothetical protein [Marinicaulis sp.]NNE41586.1 hypothetical protein [Marinicaulis sp.]NNL90550.1 hypothetical protein [Marinicaulis sp.]
MPSFADKLTGPEKDFVTALRRIIKMADRAAKEAPGAIMSAKDALCYNEQETFKYGLAKGKSGITFHSMVMYANADIADLGKSSLTGAKFQKGCINIPDPDAFDLKAFENWMNASAKKDFSPVIEHYRKKRI